MVVVLLVDIGVERYCCQESSEVAIFSYFVRWVTRNVS